MSEKVSAVLIVKDEEDKIGKCLRSVQDLDGTVVLDTGSSDATIEICETLGARVFKSPPIEPFHYGIARNRALAEVATPWALTMDADEILRPGGVGEIRKALENPADRVGFFVTFLHREARSDHSVPIPKIKLFRKDAWEWRRRYHEELHPLKSGTAADLMDVVIEHLPQADKKRRREQALILLALTIKEEPDYILAFRKFGQELMLAERHSEAIPHLQHYVEKTKDGSIDVSQAMIYLGRCINKTGNFQGAMRWFVRATETAPERREPLYEGAIALIKACRLEEALSWLERLLAIPPEKRPMSVCDVPKIWSDIEPKKMMAFCKNEIARAKAAWEEMQKRKRSGNA